MFQPVFEQAGIADIEPIDVQRIADPKGIRRIGPRKGINQIDIKMAKQGLAVMVKRTVAYRTCQINNRDSHSP